MPAPLALLLLCSALLLAAPLAAQAAAPLRLSPSIEADAEYLLTTPDFMDAHFGMEIEATDASPDRLLVRTTGADFVFDPAGDALHLNQRVAGERQVATVRFPRGALAGLRLGQQGTGAVLLSARGGKLRLRINDDSLLMLQDAEGLEVTYQPHFTPASARECTGAFLLLDERGGVGSYVVTGSGEGSLRDETGVVSHRLAPGQVLWIAVAPPKPYDWQASFRDRVVWHWSNQTGYPTDAEIALWSKYGNLLLQQSEVMLWKDWSLRFIARNGLAEFQRVNATCARYGMRNFVYTSPFYFLAGTGLESKAMNSFDHFAETGFSPGDDRGLNWPIFLEEIKKVMGEYKPGGLYFDGIYGNVVRTYLIARKAREVVGDRGILEYHATWSPPGGDVYLPQIDAQFNFVLRGEGAQARYQDPDYLRYFISTYNISNSIGVLCNNNDYKLDEPFLNQLLDNNIRLHFIPGWLGDYRKDAMEKVYWPALTGGLQARVLNAARARETQAAQTARALQEAEGVGVKGLAVALQGPFPATLTAKLADMPPGQDALLDLPGGWKAHFSPRSEGAMTTDQGQVTITARAHTLAYLQRDLPDHTVAVEARLRANGDFGMSWGAALCVRTGGEYYRLGLRSDDQAQVDHAGAQILFQGFHRSIWYWLRLRFVADHVLYEASRDGLQWRILRVEHALPPGDKAVLLVGKVQHNGGNDEYSEVGGQGTVWVDEVKVYTGGR